MGMKVQIREPLCVTIKTFDSVPRGSIIKRHTSGCSGHVTARADEWENMSVGIVQNDEAARASSQTMHCDTPATAYTR